MQHHVIENEKGRENRLRRAAKREGLAIMKSRRRDPRALDFGAYWLIDPGRNFIVAGGDHGMSLDEVEAALAE